jgi:type II secretory pathway pseudopilin PulG
MQLNKKAFSLIEIIVSCSLIVLVIGIMISNQLNTKSTDIKISEEQKYYQLLAMVNSQVKRDLRICSKINQNSENSWQLIIYKIDNEGIPYKGNIIYTHKINEKIVERIERLDKISSGKVKKYDYSKLRSKEKFDFKIKF